MKNNKRILTYISIHWNDIINELIDDVYKWCKVNHFNFFILQSRSVATNLILVVITNIKLLFLSKLNNNFEFNGVKVTEKIVILYRLLKTDHNKIAHSKLFFSLWKISVVWMSSIVFYKWIWSINNSFSLRPFKTKYLINDMNIKLFLRKLSSPII